MILLLLLTSTAMAGGGDYRPLMTDDACQPITSYQQHGWQLVEYTEMLHMAKQHGLGKIKMEKFPTLICKVSTISRTVCNVVDTTPKGPVNECITIAGKSEGEEVRWQWWWQSIRKKK